VDDVERLPVEALQIVRVVQPREHAREDAQVHAERELALHAPEERVHRLPLEVLHHHEVVRALGADVERRHEVRVGHARRDPRFVHEHRHELGVVGELLADLLDDDQLLDVRRTLPRAEDDACHSALPELGERTKLAERLVIVHGEGAIVV
jgi:hypothetical protein